MSDAFARDIEAIPPGPLRDVTAGHLALLRGRSAEADDLLRAACVHADPVRHGDLTPLIAHRLALHALGRLRGAEVVEWSGRAGFAVGACDEAAACGAGGVVAGGVGA